MSADPPVPTTYAVAVRALCEFGAKHGDLDLRFTPSPTAQQGIAGHQVVAARRAPHYRKEVALAGRYRHLQVRGRADGFDPQQGLLEEVKTFRGDLARLPANHRALHWAQAQVYGWLLCEQFGLPALNVALVYFDVATQRETRFAERFDASALRAVAEQLCERFIGWADAEAAHRAARDRDLAALRFPHAGFRPGQRTLAEAVFKGARSGRCLLAQAPTGIGKTIATVFPLLKACTSEGIDRVFFLTAKNVGKSLALDAAARLRDSAPALRLRVLELAARDNACEHPGLACHGDSCPLARGFYDRLPAAREAAATAGTLTQPVLRELARAHQVCPYYLAQEMARWCDLVVADYSHFFDDGALLHGLTEAEGWRSAVLVDEAHNLVDRARAMYSAELRAADLRALLPGAAEWLRRPLQALRRAWREVVRGQAADYQVHAELPARFVAALRRVTEAVTERLADEPAALEPALRGFYFDALRFVRLADSFGDHSLFDASRGPGRHDGTLCLRNVVPAPFLQARWAAARSATLFSATLNPPRFYRDTLGLPDDTAWLDVPTPFGRDQLAVHIVRQVSTRWRDRAGSLRPIADRIAAQYRAAPGNYLAFFSSFDYLAQVADELAVCHADVPAWRQAPRMDEAQRADFLARFSEGGQGIGFAVLGGSFGEGIDLPGTRLVGAFIATLGLPQVNPVNEALRQRLQQRFGAGYDYAYLYPGLRKVVQAAGRVIRTPEDRGVVHLIDDRFSRSEVRRLLPGWWAVEPA